MTFPSPPPAAQNSIASGTNQNSGARAGRVQQSVWGLPPAISGTRRGLAPLSTDLGSSTAEHSGPPASSTIAASPFTSTFSSIVNSSNRNGGSRTNYSASVSASASASASASPFTPLQAGSQQPHPSQVLSPRSRTITPSSNSYLASSAAASATTSQGGGVGSGSGSGSGGGTTRNQAFSPSLPPQTLSSPTNPTFDRSAFIGAAPVSLSSGQSSVSKIVITQVFLLLGSITEKEGKAKWDSQAEAIRKV
jgi:CCR4-NOT transcription complex subunit 1